MANLAYTDQYHLPESESTFWESDHYEQVISSKFSVTHNYFSST